MSVYVLFQNVTAAQSVPSPSNPPVRIVNPEEGFGAPAPAFEQAFQLVVTGTSGTVSCSAQPVVSLDGQNWSAIGSTLTLTATASPANVVSTLSAPYQFFGAYVISIGGTGASATMYLSA